MNTAQQLSIPWFQAHAQYGWRVNPAGQRGTEPVKHWGRGRGMVGDRLRKSRRVELSVYSPLFKP
jgi:hypothetical protein